MKSLLLIRHAKSSWDSPTLQDFDRPLNERGLKDAPMMAERLLRKKVHIDGWVSSTAKRAFTTAKLFAEVYKTDVQHISTYPALYHAPPLIFEQVISQLNDDWKTVAIFSHNPGITEFANQLGVARIDNMPTCSVFGVHFLCNRWKDALSSEVRFWLFDYPKNF
jgi:phosphohistidine phosphatase